MNVVNYLASKCKDIAESQLTPDERVIGDNLWETLNGYIHGHTEFFETLNFDHTEFFESLESDQNGMFQSVHMTAYKIDLH